MSAHTPGTWAVRKTPESSHQYFVVVAGKYAIASIDYAKEDEANARLIAAAPTMLAALRMAQMLRRVGGMLPGVRELVQSVCDEADAAIAAATGERT